MYELYFSGINADTLLNKVSVVNNNNADVIYLLIKKQQQSISLEGYTGYIKVQNKSRTFIDKARLEVDSISADTLRLTWHLLRKHTQFETIECQVQFQSNTSEDVVWQSAIFYLKLSQTIRADKEISDKYPTILNQIEIELADHERRIEALEEGGTTYTAGIGISILNDVISVDFSEVASYSRVETIENLIPSNASSENMLVTQSDLSNVAKLTENNAFSGLNIFNNGIKVESIQPLTEYGPIPLGTYATLYADSLYPQNANKDLGGLGNYRFRATYTKKLMNSVINNTYGVVIPDTTDFTADKTLATTDDIAISAIDYVIY